MTTSCRIPITIKAAKNRAEIAGIDAANRRAELSCDPGDECVGDFGPPTIQNNGRIESSFDVFGLGLTYHFR